MLEDTFTDLNANVGELMDKFRELLKAQIEFQDWLQEEINKVFGNCDVDTMRVLNDVRENYYEIMNRHIILTEGEEKI